MIYIHFKRIFLVDFYHFLHIRRQTTSTSFPQSRMSNLLNLLSTALVHYAKTRNEIQNFWGQPFNEIKDRFHKLVLLFKNWQEITDCLTTRYWKLSESRFWKGEKYENEELVLFRDRLSQIFRVRSTHDQMKALLKVSEEEIWADTEPLAAFSSLKLSECENYTNEIWKVAIDQYDRSVEQAEMKTVQLLQNSLSDLQSFPNQLLREFEKYEMLLSRDRIKAGLVNERQMLMGQLEANLSAVRTRLQELNMMSPELMKSKAVSSKSAIVESLIWARQMIHKLKEISGLVTSLLLDIPQSSDYQKSSHQLLADMVQFSKDRFAEWINQIETELEHNSDYTLHTTGKLMELDFANGNLKVNYGDGLVTLLRDVRILLSLNYPVPLKIQQVSDTASKYYRYAVVLKQVAHFYNTIDQQMLPCQQTMLLDLAIEFETIVKSSNGEALKSGKSGKVAVSWNSPAEMENYVKRLQEAALKLTTENRKLRKYHVMILEHVVTLMDTNLLRNQSRWKEKLHAIRDIFTSLESKGYSLESMAPWKRHWDYQLFKALEHQYQLGLESLHETLPEIKVDLVFRQQHLQLRPPFEEVKAKYYRELKKFINIPMAFRGVGDSQICPRIIEQNSSALLSVYRRAEILFQSVLKSLEPFQEWVIFGTVDVLQFIEDSLADVPDWELNFKMLKSKGRDAEQLPQQIKVDCITISTLSVKTTIDDHLQQIFDGLVHTLRKSVMKHIETIENCITNGMETLSRRPQTLAEIGESNSKHAKLLESKSSMKYHFDNAESKNKLLRNVSGSGIEISNTQSRWDKFELMLESHQLMVKEQFDQLRNAIDSRIDNFQNTVDKFAARWQQFKPKISDVEKNGTLLEASSFIRDRMSEFNDLSRTLEDMWKDCDHFSLQKPQFQSYDQLKEDIAKTDEAWTVIDEFTNEVNAVMVEDWISFRNKPRIFDDLLSKWTAFAQSRTDTVSVYVRQKIDQYAEFMACLKHLRGDSWTSDHWVEFFHLVSIPKSVNLQELKVQHIFDVSHTIIIHLPAVKEINARAQGEVSIRDALQELDVWAVSATLSLTDYTDTSNKSVTLIKEWRETLTSIGDNRSLLQSLKDTPFIKTFQDKISLWETKLSDLDEYLHNLNNVQRKWVYLEPIFSRDALPSERPRFKRVDEDFRSIMAYIQHDPRVVNLTKYSGIRDTLRTLSDQLERCQKALSEFLEQKRMKFARFYFISDDDLLEILGQSKNPAVIQTHLQKLFAGVQSVVFSEGCSSIVAIRSGEGEELPLLKPVPISGDVEDWLEKLSVEMRATLRVMLAKCLSEINLEKYPQQILDLAESINFTANCESAISKQSLTEFSEELKKKLLQLTSFDVSNISDESTRHIIGLKVKSLILDTIHHIDVVDQLRAAKAISIDDWAWQKQLRFYLDKDNLCIVRMCQTEFEYSYEYQGNMQKLVHTPLTDKCFLVLTQAMAAGFGGNPFGPAGTGKTESVKALGSLFGRQVLVFNCDEALDAQSIGRIFIGLVRCGAWGCFDEFNRLEEGVLSAVSSLIQKIQVGLKLKEQSITLLEKTITLDKNSGIFVTMNPAGKGYGGRQKLPDNLKFLFRSVAMSQPNSELIAQTELLAEGFVNGKKLGQKVVAIFEYSRQLLSQQQHYDWGLRALKTVLREAGSILRNTRKNDTKIDDSLETTIIIQALLVHTIPKLTETDSINFSSIVRDMFHGHSILPETCENQLSSVLKEAYSDLKLTFTSDQASKVSQLHNALRLRTGVVVLGPSGAGKSTLWRLLNRALVKLGKNIKLLTLNAKAMDRHTLLGHMDVDTREWKDGVLTLTTRNATKEPLDVETWIVMDGDMDPEWVEALNSVLDDNRVLTMASGERIQLGSNVKFIFETHELRYVSPATVSRLGVIYLSAASLQEAIVQAWIEQLPEESKHLIGAWIEELLYKALDWVAKEVNTPLLETSYISKLMGGLSLVKSVKSKREFVIGVIKGIGSNVSVEFRSNLASKLFQWANESPVNLRQPLETYYDPVTGTFVEYETSHSESSGIFTASSQIPVIETAEMKKHVATILPWLQTSQSLVLVGPEGSGKDTLLRYCFSKLKSTTVATINCSAQTTPAQVQQRLNQYCAALSSNAGRILKCRTGENLILYVKDIDLPKADNYGTVALISSLHQLITYKGFYDANLEWIGVENITIVATARYANPPTNLRLSSRLTSIARQYSISYPPLEQLAAIFTTSLQHVLAQKYESHDIWSFPKNISRLASTMMGIFQQVTSKFTADVASHYRFTPRDLNRWVCGLQRYQLLSPEASELLDAFANEALRIFHDRLVTPIERTKFVNILTTAIAAEWNYNINLSGYYTAKKVVQLDTASFELVKVTAEEYKKKNESTLSDFERDVREFGFSLFPQYYEFLSHLERQLSCPGGSLLLACRSGIDCRYGVLYIAHTLNYKVVSINVSRNYTIKSFYNDWKQVLQFVGVQGESVVVVFEDYQLFDPRCLEIINSVLSSGEIPGLYGPDELEAVLSSLKDEYSQTGFDGSLFDFFVHRTRQNLHVVLLTDTASPKFAVNCESNPAIYSSCQLEWLESWSHESLAHMATSILNKLSLKDDSFALVLNSILKINESCVNQSFSPGRVVNLFRHFQSVYSQIRTKLENRQHYLQGGLSKLNDAAGYVDSLSKEANSQSVLLASKQMQADQALKDITEAMIKASAQKQEMEVLSKSLECEETKMMSQKHEIEKELSEVEPILRSARDAVGGIKSDNLSEIRSLRAPPSVIRDVLEGVLRLMGVLDMSWSNMKAYLGKRTFKDEIMNFDARLISKDLRSKVESFIREKADSFEEATVKRSSVAAAPLAAWVKANLKYAEVLERVQPLEKHLEMLSQSLEASRSRLRTLREELETIDSHVAALKADFAQKTREGEILKTDLQRSTQIIQRAKTLLSKLDGERARWGSQVVEITTKLDKLPIQAAFCSGFLTYLGSLPENSRAEMQSIWSATANVHKSDFTEVLSMEREQLKWKSEGLPADKLSIENAILVLHSKICPIILDPTMQASVWLRTHLRDRNPDVINLHDSNLIRSLELAVRFGKTLIIENVDRLESALYPVIRHDYWKQGSRQVIQIADKIVDYNQNFQLFLVSKDPSFKIPSDAESFVNVINFTITKIGLTSYLTDFALRHENPELEQQKFQMLQKEEEYNNQLTSLEDKLLKELASSEGNILENQSLLDSLSETKIKSESILQSLVESSRIRRSLDEELTKYAPIASFGSSLYFVMMDLNRLNRMYQFSLEQFLRNFLAALRDPSSNPHDNPDLRTKILRGTLLKMCYNYIARSIFKTDHMALALHLLHEVDSLSIDPLEWDVLTGKYVSDEVHPHKVPNWIPNDRQKHVAYLQSALPDLVDRSNLKDQEIWRSWMKNSTCEENFPMEAKEILSPFQRLLLVQAIRPDRLSSSMENLVTDILKLPSLSPPLNLLSIAKEETNASTPVLFFLSSGSDPSQDLLDLANELIGIDNFCQIPMGQGQTALATEKLQQCMKEGKWLYLQNLHLVINWLPKLEEILSSKSMHVDFRLWLSSECHDKFSTLLLRRCLKIAFEAPPGLNKNLQRTYESWSPLMVSKVTPLCAQTLFGLAWFHAVIQERRTYIPQGWQKFYEFSTADLHSSVEIIQVACKSSKPHWLFLRGILENAIYGGRIDSSHDLNILKTYLTMIFSDELFTVGGKAPRRRIWQNIKIPTSNEHKDYVKLVSDITEKDIVSALDLPANIDQAHQLRLSSIIISQLNRLKFSSNEHNLNREQILKGLNPIVLLWQKLISDHALHQNKVSRANAAADPIEVFLHAEYNNAVNLLRCISWTFSSIVDALKLMGKLENEWEVTAASILRGETPVQWLDLWDGPLSIVLYLEACTSKFQKLEKWCQQDIFNVNDVISSPISLSMFFRPEVFLNALRQSTAKKVGKPMDALQLTSTWNSSEVGSKSFWICIQNLNIQGGKFIRGRLIEVTSDDSTYSVLPKCYIAWVQNTENTMKEGVFHIPIFKDPRRETTVAKIQMACDFSEASLILRGVSCFVEVD
ncbi:dynein heavy chain and region D6 of dynein motor-domain-containing protein [Paraphysoderma sedebokerense]|nr:dynein heavy chain and region D6 of dynein motor-domain-containing protein [Paraphysoderma sedebokerense]